MQNALLNTAAKKSKHKFMNKENLILWSFIEETFRADCEKLSPITSLTTLAVFPDRWSQMNVSVAKAPFSFNTISEMLFNVACDLDCADEIFMNDITESNIPAIYKRYLDTLKASN